MIVRTAGLYIATARKCKEFPKTVLVQFEVPAHLARGFHGRDARATLLTESVPLGQVGVPLAKW